MTGTAPPRRLYRSRSDRMLGGVAGGVAAYLGVDPALTRLAFAALVLAAGTGVLLYLIAWVVIPEEPEGTSAAGVPALPAGEEQAGDDIPGTGMAPAPAETARSGSAAGRGARLVIGSILVAVGVILLLDWAIPDLHRFFWPGAVIVFGLGLLAYGVRR